MSKPNEQGHQMSKDNPGSNWSKAEWLKVATMAYSLIQQGQKHRDAVIAAQVAVLPRDRWRDNAKLAHALAPSMTTWPKYLKRVEAMTSDERAAVLLSQVKSPSRKDSQGDNPIDQPAPAPAVKSKANGKGGGILGSNVVRWTGREWAVIARAAKWVAQQSPHLQLHQQVYEAQLWALPEDRHRPAQAIAQSFYKREGGHRLLAVQLAAGLERGWTINSVPFNPPGSEPEKSEELAPPPAVTPDPVISTAPPAAGGALPSDAPIPSVTPHSTLTEAAKAFGDTMMQALDKLLTTHAQHLLSQVNDRIGVMAAQTGTQVAAMIEAAMRQTVHSMVEQELGGPVSPPAAPANEPAPDAAPIPGETPPRNRLKVDVVGHINTPVMVQVRDQFQKSDIDLRFIDGSHSTRYKPDPNRHCIFLSKRASHGLFDKLKKYHIQPIYVEPSASYIAHAIDELQRSAMQ